MNVSASSREVVSTQDAPGAVGPYSQAIKANGMVYVSGQVGLVPGVRFSLPELFLG
jgi:2-iminobutanoate/2-iminopropanoate deaminase